DDVAQPAGAQDVFLDRLGLEEAGVRGHESLSSGARVTMLEPQNERPHGQRFPAAVRTPLNAMRICMETDLQSSHSLLRHSAKKPMRRALKLGGSGVSRAAAAKQGRAA
ncbi:hypothetical protein, partial [uncultured Thiohalocapsa sp.]|uniref:hypothetical protein n=1 Tax=uncultured Thiohalocapsa sp. TaxID=768990 RepID=UPI0025FEEE9E